ncbi:hypothetical protein [Poseidonocella sp. HB161398]|uniref:hypothetical protein n=1 Tax=Poseidonocella sp. HB161398 TaxID=2320855 RepID=UPI001108FE97|nr:hypothetical protein [Poseidonocella sp. HB161398]
MATKSFSLTLRDDGTARLSYIYRRPREPGISRLSCDLSAAGLARLAAFCEICDLQRGRSLPLGLELDALSLRFQPGEPAMLQIMRMGRSGPEQVTAPFAELHAELSEATDRCLALARSSRRGRIIWEILGQCPRPGVLPPDLPRDEADAVFHRLAEITLLSLAGEAEKPGSPLSRKLRRKKSSTEAQEHLEAALASQARLLFPGHAARVEGDAVLPEDLRDRA